MPTIESPGGARATIHEHGAHVTSWTTPDGRERLFLSARSSYREGSAIRGGVPIIFPQFSTFGPLPRHGIARTRAWRPVETGQPAHARFRLVDDDDTRATWPHAFAATYDASLDDDALSLALTIENSGSTLFAFTAALHTYLRVADVAAVAIDGLQGVTFRDQTTHGEARVEHDVVRFAGEVDRIYVDASRETTLRDASDACIVRADGFRDVVVWNPGETLAATIGDLDPGGWRRFVCIEAAAIATPIALAPGASWTGRQTLRIDPPSVRN